MRFFAAALLLVPVLGADPIPRGTEFEIRLKTKVSSATSRVKDAVEAVVTTPVLSDGVYRIAPGARLTGEVAAVKQPTDPKQRAELHLVFSQLYPAEGKPVSIKGRIVEVDNAREMVDDVGKVVGILASETLSAKMDQGLAKLSNKASGLAGLLGMAKSAVVKQTEATIEYDAGTDLLFRVLEPFEWSEQPKPLTLIPFPDEEALFDFVNSQPYQTFAQKPPKPSDMTNLMFIGTEQALKEAFEASGWTTAHDLNKATALETFRSIAEMRGYKEAPMSILLLDGQEPATEYQKGLNTFAERHHLRVFKRPGVWDGKPVWVSSSTHDTGIEFSQENRTFIHKIDPRIDRERSKVVTDLLFTGRVKSLALVERPDVPKRSQNATGDDLITDGAMAVLVIE